MSDTGRHISANLSSVSLSFGALEALSSVDCSSPARGVVGLLGPNGAGKTTLLRVLCGALVPDSGAVQVCGIDIFESPVAARANIGYMPERAPAYEELTVNEHVSFIARTCGVPGRELAGAVDRALRRSGVESVRHRLIRNLSKGFRQRLSLAGAIVHMPALIVLDEPGAGLDPNQIFELRALITELGQEHTVIVSSHIMQEIEAVADRVLILDRGRLVADGEASSLLGKQRQGVWEAEIRGDSRKALDSALFAFDGETTVLEPDTRGSSSSGNTSNAGRISLRVRLIPADSTEDGETAVFDWAVRHGLKLSGLQRVREGLESVFRRLTLHDNSEDADS